MQFDNNCFFFIADYHSLTTHPHPADLHENIKNVLIDYLAAGIDPEKSTIYVQSDVPQVCELTTLLSMNVYVGELQRVASFKEKVRRQPDNVNAGLLNYPVLMAADILIHRADKVPVGKDQEQHLELTRDFAQRFNRIYETEYFKLPVSDKITVYSDTNSLAVSSELSEMARTVNTMLETLENQEKDREIFISSVAHDIRTPLTSINGFITAMIDGTIPQDKQEQYLFKIKNEVDRIRKLIVSMTEASSLSHVDPSMMEEFNVKDVIDDITDNLEPQLREKGITVIKDHGSGPYMCYGEAQQLCRVIVNIVTNAIKFTPEGGKIKISLSPDDKARKMVADVLEQDPQVADTETVIKRALGGGK